MSFISELRRRNVVKVALAYAAISWLLIQLGTTVEEPLRLPDYFDTIVIVLLAIGFPVALVLAWAFELTPQGIMATDSVEREASITRETGQKLTQITIGVLTVAVVLLLVDRFYLNAGSDVIPNSVAVLPFENRSPGDERAYFALGLRDDVSNLLSKLRNLEVIGEATMRQYQDTDKTFLQIADELDVETLLVASVSFAEQEVAIDARLIDPREDRTIWSDAMFYPFENVFTLRSEVAMLVANAMAIEYSAEEQQTIQRAPTDSIEAYDRYLLALDFFRKATPEDLARSVDWLTEAVALDETFVDAWILKAEAHFLLGVFEDEELEYHYSERDAAIEKALALEPDNPEAIVSRARILINEELDAERAYREYLRARELSGRPLGAAVPLSLGYLKNAASALEQALILDPLNPGIYDQLIIAQDGLGNADEVRYLRQRARELGANNSLVEADYLAFLLGNAEPDEIRDFDGQPPANVRTWLEAIDDREFLRQELQALNAGEPSLIDIGWIAFFAAYVGDIELALTPVREGNVAFTRLWTSLNTEVRQHPQFNDVVTEIGFVDVWNEHGWPDLCEPLESNAFSCH